MSAPAALPARRAPEARGRRRSPAGLAAREAPAARSPVRARRRARTRRLDDSPAAWEEEKRRCRRGVAVGRMVR